MFVSLWLPLFLGQAHGTEPNEFIQVDQCPASVETVNGYNDSDGCPDNLSHLTVWLVGPDGLLRDGGLLANGAPVPGGDDAHVFDLGQRMPGTSVWLTPQHDWFVEQPAVAVGLTEGESRVVLGLQGYRRISVELTVQGSTADGPVDLVAIVAFSGPTPVAPYSLEGTGGMLVPPGDWTATVTADGYSPVTLGVLLPIGQAEAVQLNALLAPVDAP